MDFENLKEKIKSGLSQAKDGAVKVVENGKIAAVKVGDGAKALGGVASIKAVELSAKATDLAGKASFVKDMAAIKAAETAGKVIGGAAVAANKAKIAGTQAAVLIKSKMPQYNAAKEKSTNGLPAIPKSCEEDSEDEEPAPAQIDFASLPEKEKKLGFFGRMKRDRENKKSENKFAIRRAFCAVYGVSLGAVIWNWLWREEE